MSEEAYQSALRKIEKALRQQDSKLDLSDEYLTALPPEIGQLTWLRSLHLVHNRLTSLPPQIVQLKSLISLDLANNRLTSLPPEVTQLKSLISLDLTNNRLTSLPPEVTQLKSLRTLYLDDNPLTSLAPEIGQLTSLRALHLDKTQLTSLPPEITQLKSLQNLHFRGNAVTALPLEIVQLKSLRQLELASNQLTALPREIAQLTALQRLNLYNNLLTSLPPEIGELTSLETLNLRKNLLTSLPPEIAQLTSLETLYLRNNQLTALPPEITELRLLRRLEVENNHLTALPPEIGQLRSLRYVDLEGNQLTALPSDIGQLVALRQLDVRRNRLTALPAEIGHLQQLAISAQEDSHPITEGLLIEGNALPHPYPLLIAEGQPTATMNALAWLRGDLDPADLPSASGPSEPLPEAGPTFSISSGKLDLIPGLETDEAFDRATQAALHRRIIRQIEPLRAETSKVGNCHPSLALTIEEYANLVSKPLDDLDVTDLWAVGNALLAHAASFERQDERKTLTLPLEPSHLALLQDVARLHGGFILGFPKGLELTERADRAQIAPHTIRLINDPTLHILSALSRQRDLVSEWARHLVNVLQEALRVSGWETARVGYTCYATVRNALLQLGKYSILINDKGGVIGGAIAAAYLSPETVRLIAEFLSSNATDVLAFAAPFPELRAWISWILGHFEEEWRSDKSRKRL